MTSDAVHVLADYLAAVDADWRASQGYTGAAIHRRAYWLNMAARILSDGTKALATKPKIEEAMQWQPIETAPRDGTEILVLDQSTGEIDKAKVDHFGEVWPTTCRPEFLETPILWMPIPPMPIPPMPINSRKEGA